MLSQKRFARSPWFRWGLGVSVFLTAVIVAAGFILAPMVERSLVELVSERSNGQYTLRTEGVDLSLWRGRLGVRGVRLSPDSTAVELLARREGGVVLSGEVGRLVISGIAWWPLLTDNRLKASGFQLDEPRIVARAYTPEGTPLADSAASVASRGGAVDTTERPIQLSAAIQLANVEIHRGTLEWEVIGDSTTSHLSVGEVDLEVDKFRLDSLTLNNRPDRAYERFAVRLGRYRHVLPDSLHTLTVASASFFSEDGRLELDSVRLRPERPGWGFRESHPGVATALSLRTDRVTLRGFELGNFLRYQRYRARTLSVENCEAEVYVAGDRQRGDDDGAAAVRYDYDFLLDTLELADISLRYRARDPEVRVDFADADLTLLDVRNDPSRGEDPFAVADANLRFNDFETIGEDGNALRILSGRFNYAGRRLEIDSFSYRPGVGLARKASTVRGSLGLAVHRVEVAELDLPSLFWLRQVKARQVSLDGVRVDAVTNHDYPKSTRGREHLLVKLQHLGVGLAIDEIRVRDARVSYRRFGGDKEDVTLTFDDLAATFKSVGTLRGYGRAYPQASAAITANFQRIVPLRVELTWPNGRGVPYGLSGRVGAVDVARLNGFLGPMAGMRAKSGRLEAMRFEFAVDSERGRGSLHAHYAELKIEMLDGSHGNEGRGVVSALANLVAVKNDNRRGRDERVGTVAELLPAEDSMFAHWWQLVRSGIYGVMLSELGQKRLDKSRAEPARPQ